MEFRKKINNISVGSVACVIIGLLLLINPHIITDTLNSAIGVILILWGVFMAAAFFASGKDSGRSVLSLVGSVLLIIFGAYVFSHTELLERVLMISLGIYLISSGLPKLMGALSLSERNVEGWMRPFIISCGTVLVGIVVIISPALLPSIFMRAAGALLLIGGAGNFIGGLSSGRLRTELEKQHEYRHGKEAEPNSGAVVDIDSYEE